MIRRIAILEPKGERLHLFSRYQLPRLGGVLLATILRDRGYEARAFFLSQREILTRELEREADLIAISSITATAPVAYALGDYYRSLGKRVVMGGPHVTFLSEEALAHADFCILGEGEEPLVKLVEALDRGESPQNVPGLAWLAEGRLQLNPAADPLQDLDRLPFPDFTLLDSGGRKLGGPIGRAMVPIQTSRGCPCDCTFCSVTCMFGRRYRYRSTGNVLAELARYDPRKHYLFFYDDNFTSNPRRAKELLEAMIAEGLGFNWVTQVRSDVARDPEMLDLLKEAGCQVLFIGFESVDPGALREMRKSQSLEEIERAIVEIRRRRIHVHGMFVFGFDADTPATTRCSVDFALRKRIDSCQFMILTPFPGTALFQRLKHENRILDYDWETYDGHHVKFQPRRFSPWELQKAQILAHIRFFRLGRVFRRLLAGSGRAWVIGLYAHVISRRWLHWEKPYLRRLLGYVTSISRALREPAPGPWRAPRARGTPSAPR
jgi:radical SAM superfamily enzyme YgiQ (UPF0313 family)